MFSYKTRLDQFQQLDLTPLGNPKADLIREMLRLVRDVLVQEEKKGLPMEERSAFLHPEIRPRVREIGEELWNMTKDNDPGYLRWVLSCDLLSVPQPFQGEIAWVWDGLGGIVP
jgi:hypothetical protein